MTYVQVGRPQSPGPPEEVDPLDFLRVQLRLLGQEPEETGGGKQLDQFSLVHGRSFTTHIDMISTIASLLRLPGKPPDHRSGTCIPAADHPRRASLLLAYAWHAKLRGRWHRNPVLGDWRHHHPIVEQLVRSNIVDAIGTSAQHLQQHPHLGPHLFLVAIVYR